MTTTHHRLWLQTIHWIRDLEEGRISFPHFLESLGWLLQNAEGSEFDAIRAFHNLWKPLGTLIDDPFHSHDSHAQQLRAQIRKLEQLLIERQRLWEISNSFHSLP